MDETVAAIRFDVSTLTLGEMMAAEEASGRPIEKLLSSGRGTLRLLAVFIHQYRNSEKPPSWSELAGLRLSDSLPSTSPSSDSTGVSSKVSA
jgi:hypothetical protein